MLMIYKLYVLFSDEYLSFKINARRRLKIRDGCYRTTQREYIFLSVFIFWLNLVIFFTMFLMLFS